MGETGEHADWSSWIVCVYDNRKAAKARAKAANEVAREIRESLGQLSWNLSGKKNPHDLNMRMDYTGTFYKVEKVPFITLEDE